MPLKGLLHFYRNLHPPSTAFLTFPESDLIVQLFKINNMDYFKYSWGFGFKIQIPMMPLRFWFGRKVAWVGKEKGYFEEISGFNFQFAIGDMRF